MKQLITIALCVVAAVMGLQGQDMHFTQFHASPLTLNPANTAHFYPYDYRVGGNFKQQWPWAHQDKQYNYITTSAYGDIAMLKDKLPGGDWMGVGLMVLNDKAGDGLLSTNKVHLSVAYHMILGAADRLQLSGGIGLGFVNKSVDYEKLYFDSQWSDTFFDTELPNGEENADDNVMYFDMHAGLNFTMFVNDKVSFTIGGGAFHLNRPKESLVGGDNRLAIRPLANASAFVRFSDHWHIEPNIIYMNQRAASETLVNVLAGYTFTGSGALNETTLLIGSTYRMKDALAPMAGFEYKGFRLLANYDVNLSDLSEASNNVGGFELSVVYMGRRPGTINKVLIPCPRL